VWKQSFATLQILLFLLSIHRQFKLSKLYQFVHFVIRWSERARGCYVKVLKFVWNLFLCKRWELSKIDFKEFWCKFKHFALGSVFQILILSMGWTFTLNRVQIYCLSF